MPEIVQTISHYRITEKLGAGGMGEVFLAEDSHLNRRVAIKVLPDEFARDPERLARSDREAKLLASLSHPNIAAIHGLEKTDGKLFLVMEMVEGETLAQRLGKGPLPVEEGLEICRQIAEGLEAAHEKGIIHRDLKPANIEITPEGTAKVLDFGLAKVLEESPGAANVTKSPTLSLAATEAGVILGTAAYMPPEQARGKAVDRRADIWAFGCVLYEILTGQRAFAGDDVTDVIVAVMRKEPDWRLLPPTTPGRIVELVKQCLKKDPRERWRDIGDARLEIAAAPAAPADNATSAAGSSSARRRTMPWVAGALAGALIAGFAAWS